MLVLFCVNLIVSGVVHRRTGLVIAAGTWLLAAAGLALILEGVQDGRAMSIAVGAGGVAYATWLFVPRVRGSRL